MQRNMKKSTEISDYRLDFLKRSLLKRSTDINNPNSVLYACCVLAYADMLSAGKYYLYEKGKENKELRISIIKSFLEILERNNYVYSRDLIVLLLPLFGGSEIIKKVKKNRKISYIDYATRFGLCQKFVNMCFKYFYVFEKDMPDYHFDFTQCDCPLDSVIIGSLIDNKNLVWSKLEYNNYVKCQDEIKALLSTIDLPQSLESIGLLAYDFMNW